MVALVMKKLLIFDALFIFNKQDNSVDKQLFDIKLANRMIDDNINMFSITKVFDVCSKLKKGKSTGPDGISNEALIFGCPSLYVHLCLVFNLFMKHGFLPGAFMDCTIVPLIKNRNGDLSDTNNYRAIALSNAISKLFELLILESIVTNSDYDDFQFGFKPHHSTGLCTNVLKNTIDYYRRNGSHVFTCFIDFSKAFDNVNYWKLFVKLLDDNINSFVVKVLAYWYSQQECCVRWGDYISSPFTMSNGTRQGSVLSPYLFARYIRELIGSVIRTGVGCAIGN